MFSAARITLGHLKPFIFQEILEALKVLLHRHSCDVDLLFNTAMLCFVAVGGGSDLRLWTVNGDLVGHVHCRESICSVAFSNQPEGVSVNVIAGGLENGVVR